MNTSYIVVVKLHSAQNFFEKDHYLTFEVITTLKSHMLQHDKLAYENANHEVHIYLRNSVYPDIHWNQQPTFLFTAIHMMKS